MRCRLMPAAPPSGKVEADRTDCGGRGVYLGRKHVSPGGFEMERKPEREARQDPKVETQRDAEICKHGANVVAGPAQVCKLCGSPDCPGVKSGNVRQSIKLGKAFDSPPYGLAEVWCHGGARMLLPGFTEESDVVTDIIWWRGGGSSWLDITDWLNERGIRMRDGGAWTWPRVRAVVKFVYRDQWLLTD